MTTPKFLTGRPIHKIQISSDKTTGNLQELGDQIIGAVRMNRGIRRIIRTKGKDEVTRYVVVKEDPSIELEFDPGVGATEAMAICFVLADGDRAFVVEKESETSGVGLHADGIGGIDSPLLTLDSTDDGTTSMTLTIRPVGTPWNWSLVTT